MHGTFQKLGQCSLESCLCAIFLCELFFRVSLDMKQDIFISQVRIA